MCEVAISGKVLLEGEPFAVTNSSSVSLDAITSWGRSCDVAVSGKVLLEGEPFAVTNSSSVSLDGNTSWGRSCDVAVSAKRKHDKNSDHTIKC